MYSYKCLSSIQSKDIFHDNDLEILFSLVAEYVWDPVVLDKVCQYLRQFVSDGGIYVDIERGISLGCPLSPLMGALSRFIVATRVGQHTDQFIAELIANTEGTTNGVLSGFLGMSEQNATASRIEEYARRWFIWVTKWCSECRVR